LFIIKINYIVLKVNDWFNNFFKNFYKFKNFFIDSLLIVNVNKFYLSCVNVHELSSRKNIFLCKFNNSKINIHNWNKLINGIYNKINSTFK